MAGTPMVVANKAERDARAEIVHAGFLDIQVCVPHEWTDEEVKTFADSNHPCGTENGWQITRAGDEVLKGAEERETCATYDDFVHIMLQA